MELEQARSKNQKYSTIKGFLRLFILFLLFSVFYSFISLMNNYNQLDEITGLLSDEVPYTGLYFGFILLINLICTIASFVLLMFALQYKKSTRKFAIILFSANIVVQLVDLAVCTFLFYDYQQIIKTMMNPQYLLTAFSGNFIWLCYFIFSKRVQRTFVK